MLDIYSRYAKARREQLHPRPNVGFKKSLKTSAHQVLSLSYGNINVNRPTSKMIVNLVRGSYQILAQCNPDPDSPN